MIARIDELYRRRDELLKRIKHGDDGRATRDATSNELSRLNIEIDRLIIEQ